MFGTEWHGIQLIPCVLCVQCTPVSLTEVPVLLAVQRLAANRLGNLGCKRSWVQIPPSRLNQPVDNSCQRVFFLTGIELASEERPARRSGGLGSRREVGQFCLTRLRPEHGSAHMGRGRIDPWPQTHGVHCDGGAKSTFNDLAVPHDHHRTSGRLTIPRHPPGQSLQAVRREPLPASDWLSPDHRDAKPDVVVTPFRLEP